MPFLCAYVGYENHRPATCSGIITYMRTASFDANLQCRQMWTGVPVQAVPRMIWNIRMFA